MCWVSTSTEVIKSTRQDVIHAIHSWKYQLWINMFTNGIYSNNHWDIYPSLSPVVTLPTCMTPLTLIILAGTWTDELHISSELQILLAVNLWLHICSFNFSKNAFKLSQLKLTAQVRRVASGFIKHSNSRRFLIPWATNY